MEKHGPAQLLLVALLMAAIVTPAIPSVITSAAPPLDSVLPEPFSPRDPPTSCVAELVALSPCLSYISAPPNCIVSAPSAPCCDSFSLHALCGSVGGGWDIAGPACMCHLVRDPMLLGFPVLTDRVASLFRTCGPAVAGDVLTGAFLSLCQAPGTELPPLRTSPAVGDGSTPANASNSTSNNGAGSPPAFVRPPKVSKDRGREGKSKTTASVSGAAPRIGWTPLLALRILIL